MLSFYLICHIPCIPFTNCYVRTLLGYGGVNNRKLLRQPKNTALAHYDATRSFKLNCDASAYGIGTCLVHVMDDNSQKPIAYASRTLMTVEMAYAQIEWEGLALVFGVCCFHQYLYGRSFTLVTNHQSLQEHVNGIAKQCADCM